VKENAMRQTVDDFKIGEVAMRYSPFVPRLYNYCLSLGFQRDLTMSSRSFCSDETQGYPVVLLMQHFGVFPFDHGRVCGRVATDRHGPHAGHGEDLVIVHASHVGYDHAQLASASISGRTLSTEALRGGSALVSGRMRQRAEKHPFWDAS
jgi:hypothetical protein